jgi:hypothetical protein
VVWEGSRAGLDLASMREIYREVTRAEDRGVRTS